MPVGFSANRITKINPANRGNVNRAQNQENEKKTHIVKVECNRFDASSENKNKDRTYEKFLFTNFLIPVLVSRSFRRSYMPLSLSLRCFCCCCSFFLLIFFVLILPPAQHLSLNHSLCRKMQNTKRKWGKKIGAKIPHLCLGKEFYSVRFLHRVNQVR